MIRNVDEMMVHLYNSLHIYVCGVVCLFQASAISNYENCTLESVPVHVSKSLVPKKAHLRHLSNPPSFPLFWLITLFLYSRTKLFHLFILFYFPTCLATYALAAYALAAYALAAYALAAYAQAAYALAAYALAAYT